MTWRTGRRAFRTIYIQDGAEPSDTDRLIGMMDTPETARLAAAAPELLAAAKLAAAHHQGAHSVPGRALRAAIAKATGDTSGPCVECGEGVVP